VLVVLDNPTIDAGSRRRHRSNAEFEKARVQHNLTARWFERETREQEVRP